MRTGSRQNQILNAAAGATEGTLPARERVLEAACEMFAEAGYHGTHLRQICRRAGTNLAGVCYHFHSKEGLYEAVIMEAGRRLATTTDSTSDFWQLPPQQRLFAQIESLAQRLSAGNALAAKLLVRELLEPPGAVRNYVASGLEGDFLLLQASMKELCGAGADTESIRLQALSILGECVLNSLIGKDPHHPLAGLAVNLPSRSHLARCIVQRAMGLRESHPEFSEKATL